jgi:hypothetical protein
LTAGSRASNIAPPASEEWAEAKLARKTEQDHGQERDSHDAARESGGRRDRCRAFETLMGRLTLRRHADPGQ